MGRPHGSRRALRALLTMRPIESSINLSAVMRGLDPRIHDERPHKHSYCRNCDRPSWIAESSPAMTASSPTLSLHVDDNHPRLCRLTAARDLIGDRVRAMKAGLGFVSDRDAGDGLARARAGVSCGGRVRG